MKKVICFGTFDILHLGHLNYFEQAKTLGDYLIVVIARDETKKKMNKEIIFNEQERLKLVQSLKIVDKAVLGDLKDQFKTIKEENPAVICLGYDHPIKEEELKQALEKLGLRPEIKRMKPYKQKEQNSSKLREILKQL